MSNKYRLEPLLRIKARAKRRAEIILARAIGHLEREKTRKEELETEKADLNASKKEARTALDNMLYSESGVVADSFRYTDFLKGLDEDVKQKDRDIERQDGVIEDANVVVSRARRDYIGAAQECEVMEKHKELWEKRREKEITRREQKEMDDLGQVIHQLNVRAQR